ncbi:alpha/beta fold hydrolase [Piscibacillus halophilus]|uniref:Proline iminopeptidase n=1 Tax=Piscibacillus halophilus TaxID=571933 RepID=A0A1H9A3F0_9BACI|nr:alpha/beta hydrolase [Piscibacillus halophilus]SEP71041.1 proline iminopeptidase [Piscibacillus halophilus]
MWEQMFVNTDRGEFEIFVSGNGEPLCVTHLYSEFNERGNYFADMFLDAFRVYLVNLKEAGNSSKVVKKEELSMQETVRDLEAIREALGIKEWSFAGNSTGGMLGLVYGINHSHSLKRLLVGGATATYDYMNHEDSIYCRLNPKNERLKEIFSILKSNETTQEKRKQVAREWTAMSLYDPSRFDEYFSKPSSGRVVQKRLDYYSFEELPDYDIRDQLSEISTSTFVFCGKHDSQCPLIFSQEIQQLVPNSILYVFDKSSHFPFLEEKEEFTKMVDHFKTRV